MVSRYNLVFWSVIGGVQTMRFIILVIAGIVLVDGQVGYHDTT